MRQLLWFFYIMTATVATACETHDCEINSSYIKQLNPLYFNTAFVQSGKVFSISMACGSANQPTCKQATIRLAGLTRQQFCQENFFIATINEATFAPDGKTRSEIWLRFSFWTELGGKITLGATFPKNTQWMDCTRPYAIMVAEKKRYR